MPFGLCNAPGTFERAMELIMKGLQWRTLILYLDDIIVMSSTIGEHINRLDEVLGRLGQAGLKLKPNQLARWIEILSQFDFDIEHRAGRNHGNADAMSRIPCDPESCDCYDKETIIEQLPCGGCTTSVKRHKAWSQFFDEDDDVVPGTHMRVQQTRLKSVRTPIEIALSVDKPDINDRDYHEYAANIVSTMTEAYNLTREHLASQTQRQKRDYDARLSVNTQGLKSLNNFAP
ncbi:uncharacterized protein LOC115923367 [Strongylocentrotus purpuratus]|uniref:Reverse transcriptase domain-containing protein n=1 Tax=Strongylocentrotus purpuratus TaxID=7668 RepID=A0A7M7NPG5_STRPU|nr:uncharacterized protein LOC115923367 [Strongylocentrotus purpuratus]